MRSLKILYNKGNKKKKERIMKYITDKFWNEVKYLFPEQSKMGRPEFDRKKAFNGILHILITGSQWHMLPEKYGKPTTVHGKFMRWIQLGIFKKIIVKAREYYRKRNSKNNWYAFDTISKKAPFARWSGKSPVDRGKRAIKHAILVDRKGAPLFVDIAPRNKHDSKLLTPVLNQLNKSKQIRILAVDSAFDVKKLYKECKEKNIALVASKNKRRDKDIQKIRVLHRWLVEQSFGILSWFRGLKIC